MISKIETDLSQDAGINIDCSVIPFWQPLPSQIYQSINRTRNARRAHLVPRNGSRYTPLHLRMSPVPVPIRPRRPSNTHHIEFACLACLSLKEMQVQTTHCRNGARRRFKPLELELIFVSDNDFETETVLLMVMFLLEPASRWHCEAPLVSIQSHFRFLIAFNYTSQKETRLH
jgi:hypothetical protein